MLIWKATTIMNSICSAMGLWQSFFTSNLFCVVTQFCSHHCYVYLSFCWCWHLACRMPRVIRDKALWIWKGWIWSSFKLQWKIYDHFVLKLWVMYWKNGLQKELCNFSFWSQLAFSAGGKASIIIISIDCQSSLTKIMVWVNTLEFCKWLA